jgi:dTDP-4-dehydrorhamnose 3,5-epimerase-like enzyme
MKNVNMTDFKDFGGKLGHLTPIEANCDIPFDIKRIYYITKVPSDITRGFHSHRKLEQVLICISGSVKVRIKTPFEEEVIELNDSAKGLYIGHMIWREMFDFSKDAVLLVLASEYYTENDYIRDYQTYLKEYEIYQETLQNEKA